MNTAEFDREFDLLYDNASKGAPSIDKYEKSVYLTTAQEELVKACYTGRNASGVGFEGSELKRRWLSELVRNYKVFAPLPTLSTTTLVGGLSSDQVPVDDKLTTTSQFFALPTDLFFIVLEKVKLKSTNACLNNKIIRVKPTTHDEFLIEQENPFRKPNARKAWRLDVLRFGSTQKAELFAIDKIAEYHVRYIKKPLPIILANFEQDPELDGMDLTVDGRNTITQCELNSEAHRDILNRAVELAVRDYRENSLKARVETNMRNSQ